MHAHGDPFRKNAFCSHSSFPFSPVAHPQDPHHSSEKPAIQCHKCGEPCKGEVLRVQTKHFHIKCFTCKGTGPPASWLRGMAVGACLGVRPPPSSTPSHQMISEHAQKPRNHSTALVWDWIRLKGESGSHQDQGYTGLWGFTDMPDPGKRHYSKRNSKKAVL